MTAIQWTDESWNPVTGCTKVSTGCKHCYAEALFPRVYPRRAFGDVRLHPERLEQPLRWRKPRRVFVNSMSDFFHEDVPFEFIASVFGVMAACQQHTFQILTKRPERMLEWFEWEDARVRSCHAGSLIARGFVGNWPLPNVWLGVSVENQEAADARIPLLLETPAAVRFLSVEPLLGPVDLTRLPVQFTSHIQHRNTIDWVIVGGESGSKARPCDVAWIRSVVAQCHDAGVPCFVKQLGANTPGRGGLGTHDRKGGDPEEWPEDLRVREFPVTESAR